MNPFVPRSARKPKWRVASLTALVGLAMGACTFDADDRCGPHQKFDSDNDRCVCEPSAAYTPAGCVPCGANEMPGNGACVCVAGFTRSLESGSCEPAPAALGAECSSNQECADATYSHCQLGSSQSGYCTNTGCASSADCQNGYACDTSASPSYCKRPPVGLGKSCASPDDCAGGEATFCDTFQSHSCLVANCTLMPDNCFEGWACTDLSAFGMPIPLCLPKVAQ
ncbi:MAG: hypothetical protein ACOY0T_08280 [Myxococcota bacterium]